MTRIRHANFPADEASVVDIWREFIANAGISLAYQANEAEFANLPGKYAAPGGCVLLAAGDGIDGCIALRPVDGDVCEMKRLYVRPHARGCRLGRTLVERLLTEARRAGYREVRLDVMEHYLAARRLYAEFGFVAAEPVSFNPTPGASFLGLRL